MPLRAPTPPPFVKVGDEIQVGQVVCIIEAMKLMNEIEADVKPAKLVARAGRKRAAGRIRPAVFAIRPAEARSSRAGSIRQWLPNLMIAN
jgi:acetyl-CoA carboxylase biotin carboxyl carrier protein